MARSIVVDMKLEEHLRQAFADLNIPVVEAGQDNRAVRQHAFKMPRGGRGRTYAYVLYEDRQRESNDCNLVFRFRSGAKPERWFSSQEASSFERELAARFARQWDQDSGTPANMVEAARATDQYGMAITREDLASDAFDAALRRFVGIAVEAVGQASKQSTRDWSRYEELTD